MNTESTGDRSIKYRITVKAGPAEAEIAGYLYPGDPGKPGGPVTTPGQVGSSGRLNYDSGRLSKGYTRVTTIPAAFAGLCKDADLAGYRPVKITVEANQAHGTREASSGVKTPGHLVAAFESAMQAAGVTIRLSGVPARLYCPPA
jgi:hypothetical protein